MGSLVLLRRLLLVVPTLFGVALVVFVLMRVVPGDPISMMIGPGASAQDIAALRALYGLDHGIATQFAYYLRDLLGGDFGISMSRKQSVSELIAQRLPLTLELSAIATLLALTLGVAAALVATHWRQRRIEGWVDAATGVITAIPDFLWGLLGILLFGVVLPWLPVFGLMDSDLRFEAATGFVIGESLLRGRLDVFASVLWHLLLPAVALALPLAAMVARVLKASLAEALAQDYVLIARVKGFSPWRVLLREALRNALSPALTLAGVQFTFLIGGTVLIEKLFGLPGLGNMAIDAVTSRDLPLIQGIVLTFALIFIAVNLVVDALNTALNPRLRGH
jgi:ABC-type dipeptide/oligopeptide/nickel transport system permease component